MKPVIESIGVNSSSPQLCSQAPKRVRKHLLGAGEVAYIKGVKASASRGRRQAFTSDRFLRSFGFLFFYPEAPFSLPAFLSSTLCLSFYPSVLHPGTPPFERFYAAASHDERATHQTFRRKRSKPRAPVFEIRSNLPVVCEYNFREAAPSLHRSARKKRNRTTPWDRRFVSWSAQTTSSDPTLTSLGDCRSRWRRGCCLDFSV